jgi:predicted ATP-grasp superfamily ATP-dependent carboligase
MRVFVYEYLSSGALGDTVAAASLRAEGWAMLAAILEDFGGCHGVEMCTLIDARLGAAVERVCPHITLHFARPGAEEQMFRSLAAEVDFSLVIAPEFDDILAQRCGWVEEVGGHLLGPSASAVRLTGDKRMMYRNWVDRQVPTPYVVDPPDEYSPVAILTPCVCKPRCGAGSQATFLLRNSDDLIEMLASLQSEGRSGETILQAHAPGLPVSAAFLAGAGRLLALPATEQHLSSDGRFRYLGGRLPLEHCLDQRARRLAERAVRAVEGLHGYFGVDLVLGEAIDGSADVAIEINPRLTTSYVGLRRLARFNLAEALLAIAAGSPPPSWNWRSEPIVFRADGTVQSVISPG